MGYSFYNPSENKVFVARNVEFFENDLIDQKASGSVEDLKLIQKEDTNPSFDASLDHEEDDQEIDEPQRDLGEPANYKAALMDSESKKWLDAMNVEIQSMKYNDVCVLVELPPNARTVGSKWPLSSRRLDMAQCFSCSIRKLPTKTECSEEHWTAVKNILKYLRNTKDMFLISLKWRDVKIENVDTDDNLADPFAQEALVIS
ncbi:hypothetical protein Tco_1213364 [Tanacetum coccineum]